MGWMMEDKQIICDKICEALQQTHQFRVGIGGNGLKEFRYIVKGATLEPNVRYPETVRPIFEDGTGENGYYDINVSCDSGAAMFIDITRQFIERVI